MDLLRSLFAANVWVTYLSSAARGLLLAVPVALVFEAGGALTRRYVLKQLNPLLGRDAGRDPAGRSRRRRQLRDWTVIALRWLQNTAALLVIFTLWRLEPLAVALVVAALALLLKGLVKDFVAAWSLVADDCLAVGDKVSINGGPGSGGGPGYAGGAGGTVAECGPRRVKLLDEGGRAWWIRCSEIRSVLNASAPTGEVSSHER
jgi:small-conductance mechanosensitive channel